jgi:hypothetical protein
VPEITKILRFLAPLVAAILVGNWFLSEVKKARATNQPWYRPYLSTPGLLIILAAILIPIFLWVIKKG